MLRLVPWTRDAGAHAAIMDKVTWSYSLFVAVVEQVAPGGALLGLKQALAPDRGYYRLRVQVAYRSENIKTLVKRHKLSKLSLFRDEKGEVIAERLLEAATETVNTTSFELMAVAWPLLIGRQVAAEMRLEGILDLKLENLEAGLEIAGTLEEIKMLHGSVLGAIDGVHSKLLFALGFDTGEVVIAAPGKPPKAPKDKPKGPRPSTWR